MGGGQPAVVTVAGGGRMLWDQHTCVALRPDADVSELRRYAGAAGAFVSLNAGYAPHPFAVTSALLDAFRRQVEETPGLELADTLAEVDAIRAGGAIAVAFDLEDCRPLDGDLGNVAVLYGKGVRTLAPTYNHANAAGCGCLDVDDSGLTAWGRRLVAEMNAVGMVPDGSHGSAQTGLDLCRVSTTPVVYSHSCMRAVWEHPRNITDDQARACADSGGVVGITGVGIFLGPNTPTLEAMTRHLEHAVELVGIDHVGVSSDFSFDWREFRDEIAANTDLYDDSYTRWGPMEWMPPETLVGLGAHLASRGWAGEDIDAVLGGNFRRVAAQTWG